MHILDLSILFYWYSTQLCYINFCLHYRPKRIFWRCINSPLRVSHLAQSRPRCPSTAQVVVVTMKEKHSDKRCDC